MSAPTASKHKIVLVEDHPVTRAGIAALLNQSSDFEVCGQSDAPPLAMELIRTHKPDLVIVDLSLKGSSGIDLVKALKVSLPDLPVLVLSMHDESMYAERSLRAGARGYVMKQEASEHILDAARRVLKKELYLSEKMRNKLFHGLVKRKPGEEAPYSMDALSEREMEVFLLIGRGESTRRIAELLGISIKTVDTYREHLKVKLRLEGSAELIHHAVQWVKSEKLLS